VAFVITIRKTLMSEPTVVIAPDSFKGSLAAAAVARAIAAGLAASDHPPCTVLAPQADGGEGLLDAVAATRDGTWQSLSLTGVHGRPVEAPWYVLAGGSAVLESATVIGLPLVETAAAPLLAERSSRALGVLLAAVVDSGVSDIAIGLGGSACNDAGLGLLIALGAVAYDASGQVIAPSMHGLLSLARLDLSRLDPRLRRIRLRVFCDVDNPLLGAAGACRVYGPQKGLTAGAIDAVEAAFARLAELAGAHAQATWAGSGAAGGLGFALAVLGGQLEAGAEAVLQLTDLAGKMQGAASVITGEGRSDRQTLAGKLPLAIAQAARPVPTLLVSGAVTEDARAALARHFALIRTLVERAGSLDAARAEPERWLYEIGRDIGGALPAILAEQPGRQ
jgi:glycerate kinase